MRGVLLGPNGQVGTDVMALAAARGLVLEPMGRDRLDVSDPAAVRAVLETMSFDVLINCTGYHKTDEVEDNADQAMRVNALSVRAMAECCGDKGARFVHISTDYVFPGMKGAPYREDDAIGPLNVYGASKAMGESLVRLVGGDHLILRVASLFGVAGASGKGGNFVETMIRVGREKGELKVVDDVTMSPTATADVAKMILSLLERGAPAGTYHAVNSGSATWYEFAREIIARAGVPAEVRPCTSAEFPTKAQRPAYSVLDNARLAAVIGEIPHWTDALDRYLRAKGHHPAPAEA